MVIDPTDPLRSSVRGLLFGSVADRYERYRAGYPSGVLDTIVGYAGRPLRTALEVGAGTGKATRAFAGHGIEVTALEPDADMAKVLATTTEGLPVRPVITTFEGFATDDHFDLVFAAAAWHWTRPAIRWARAVELLVADGVLALFGAPGELTDPSLFAAVDEIEKRMLDGDNPAEVHPWSLQEMAAAAGLGDVRRYELPSVTRATAGDFVGRLATLSAYLKLAAEQREDALSQVRSVLPDHVEIDTTVQISLGRRTDQSAG